LRTAGALSNPMMRQVAGQKVRSQRRPRNAPGHHSFSDRRWAGLI